MSPLVQYVHFFVPVASSNGYRVLDVELVDHLIIGHHKFVSLNTSRHIAAAAEQGIVQVWDVKGRSISRRYENHTGNVFAIAWSSDGKYIASAGLDKTVQIWEAKQAVIYLPIVVILTVSVQYHGPLMIDILLLLAKMVHYASGSSDKNLSVYCMY